MGEEAQKLKRSVNLAELIVASGVSLQKQGQNRFVGLCPFHREETPSFTVNPGEGLWHCFGCERGGDVFTFLQELHKISFQEAVDLLRRGNGRRKGAGKKAGDGKKAGRSKNSRKCVLGKALDERSGSAAEHKPDSPKLQASRSGAEVIAEAGEKPQSINPRALLNQVGEYYHKTFYEDTRGLEYLRDRRGIHDPEIYETFKLGFANGSIFRMLPGEGEILDILKTLGIITPKGSEFFYNHVIFPVFNEDGQVTGIYGRAIDDGARAGQGNDEGVLADRPGFSAYSSRNPHLYLPGPHRGVFNWQAAKRSSDLFLTEAFIDAMSLYQAGYRDVIPLYGTGGLTPDHIELFRMYRTRKLNLVLDSDRAGDEACSRVASALPEIECFKVTLPVKDANEFFHDRGHTKEEFAALVAKAEIVRIPKDSLSKGLQYTVSRGDHSQCAVSKDSRCRDSGDSAFPASFPETPNRVGSGETSNIVEPLLEKPSAKPDFAVTFDKLIYHVKIIPSYDNRLKVTLKVFSNFSNSLDSSSSTGSSNSSPGSPGSSTSSVSDGKTFLDTIDLYSHRSRQSAANQIAKRFSLSKDRVESELMAVVNETEKFEWEKAHKEREKPKAPSMTEEEKVEALAWLTSPRLVEELMTDMDVLGYVGEPSNKLLSYLIGISRKLERPLSGIISSGSGSGKSHLAEIIEQMSPPEEVILFSRLSPQALCYMEKDFLKGKLLIIEERCGSEAADYSIRTLQSRRKITQGVVIKDPATGRMHTKTYTVEGPIAYLETTTSGSVNPENSTRCFELYLDESKAQTGKVHDMQRVSRMYEGISLWRARECVIRKHQNAQRLLRPLKVVIPYAMHLSFPTEWLRTRRDNERFLCLIEAVAFLHQHRREVKLYFPGGDSGVNDEREKKFDAGGDGESRQRGVVGGKSDNGVNGEKRESDKIEYIEATLDDYRVAFELAKEVLTHTLSDLKKASREILEDIIEMVKEKAQMHNVGAHEITFSRREIREYTSWSDKKVRESLSQLVDLEYLQMLSGSQGKSCLYQLPDGFSCPGFSVRGLITPEELEEKL